MTFIVYLNHRSKIVTQYITTAPDYEGAIDRALDWWNRNYQLTEGIVQARAFDIQDAVCYGIDNVPQPIFSRNQQRYGPHAIAANGEEII